MWRHRPDGYECPLCPAGELLEAEQPVLVLCRYEQVVVRLQRYWKAGSEGGALVYPVEHYENLFDLPVELGAHIQRAVRDVAAAMKSALGCDGISVRQNNEPAGGQDIWHHHVHVFPRTTGRLLDGMEWFRADVEEMHGLAERLIAGWPASATG